MSTDSSPAGHYLGTIVEVASGMTSPALHNSPMDDDSDDDVFIYPGDDDLELQEETHSEPEQTYSQEHDRDLSPFPQFTDSPTPPAPAPKHPSPAQLEALQTASSSGDLKLLQQLFGTALQSGELEAFALANDASSRTGLTALHTAASRGYLGIVKWLIEDCGAMPDIEDKEGETALHKAALHGHLPVIQYLLPDRADVHAQDADGWTALHNACSKGYLDIVRWLCESGGAASTIGGIRGVDVRSQGGWTPLMNAASKGHLPVVLYLISKQSADPLVRNNWGETAYDAAAAVFEVWICEVLQRAEMDRWRNDTVPYNTLAVHTTVPLILYENQRLDTRLKTLAVSGGRPRFTASGLGKHGHPAPFELKLVGPNENGQRSVPAWRSDVQLPVREDPWSLPTPGNKDGPKDGAERSHFWLSDWTLDVTHPGVDAEEGWQYAHALNDPDDQWSAEQPPPLERLLNGNGIVAAGLGGSSPRNRSRSRASSSSSSGHNSQFWVRRRRWVRVMRRRLDIPPLPFLQPDGQLYHLAADGTMIPYIESSDSEWGDNDGQELGTISSAQDYVARARYLADSQYGDSAVNGAGSAVDTRRAIAKLELATFELRRGIQEDQDLERRTQAEVLLNAYTRELDRRRSSTNTLGLTVSDQDEAELDDDSSEEFHFPASPTETTRPASLHSSSTDYFGRSARGPTDLTPHLAQSPEFRVPTHEAPQKVLTPRWTPPTPHQIHAQWERDDNVHECRDCRRRFNFLNRRHCRRCGRIFCDRCSTFRAVLDPSDVVHDPSFAESSSSTSLQRVCQSCHEEVTASAPQGILNSRTTSMERIVIDQRRLSVPSPTHGETSSQLSDLAECPVCNTSLADLGSPPLQEAHVKNCLEGGGGGTPQSAKYLVYKLPAESALIGVECVICLEEFVKGSTVARLSCLCSFHNACLSSWLQRGKCCPIHAR